jgi:hypothetical protein
MKRCSTMLLSLAALVALATEISAADGDKNPQPRIVRPGQVTADGAVTPPEDAVIIFDGRDGSNFTDTNGNPISWPVADGSLRVGRGDIVSKQTFSDAQIHVEFSTANEDKHFANSGLYLHHLYEIQIMESYTENPYGPGQQNAAIYQTYRPLVNASTPPGTWQTLDIIFHGAKLDAEGAVRQPARFTVFHNGVLVQYNRSLRRGTGAGQNRKMIENGPLRIQAHGGDVRYRSIWFRNIPPISESTAGALNKPRPDGPAPKITAATPTTNDAAGQPPSDSLVLFDGKALDAWSRQGDVTQQPDWKIQNGYAEVAADTIVTKKNFGDVQLHAEWATPADGKGHGQDRGNSGIKMELVNEVQVLDSYHNETYAEGHAGAIYGQYPPLVNASRPPGQWQTYDIVYRTAKYDKNGDLIDPGSFTVLHNGILVQDHVALKWPRKKGPADGPVVSPILLQSKGIPVRYRNIWLRELAPQIAEPPDIARLVPEPQEFVFNGREGIFQAEEADVDGAGIIHTNPGYTGSGFVDFRAAEGEKITWSVKIPEAGRYRLAIRYSTGADNQPLKLVVNGETRAEPLQFPSTGDWDTWGEVAQTVELHAGANEIRLISIGHSGANIDRIALKYQVVATKTSKYQ